MIPRMSTLLITHPACILHNMGPGHPEQPDRLNVILDALNEPEFSALKRSKAGLATLEQIARCHPLNHVEKILAAIPEHGLAAIDADTSACKDTGEAALRAAGAVIDAVDAVMTGKTRNAFCAVRPPGHHAEPEKVMGFCLFNNVAIGAEYAIEKYGLERVAIVDFDVHHGNGTQAIAYDRPHLFYASTHQMPLYPGTGHANETGVANNVVNVPLEPMSGSGAFRRAYQEVIIPALRAYRPDLLMISAGFDAHHADPLAQLMLTEDDYSWITGQLVELSEECCCGRLVSSLEGGYDLAALARSTALHVKGLMVL